MGNIVKNHHSKFELNATRNDGALGFFQRASPPNNNNNNNNNNNKISSVWGPVPGPKNNILNQINMPRLCSYCGCTTHWTTRAFLLTGKKILIF